MGFLARYRSKRQCPSCGSYDVARSRHHGLLEWFLRTFLRLRAYRCRSCMNRYFGYLHAIRAVPEEGQREAA